MQTVRSQSDGGESKGHEWGQRIVEILGKNKSDYTDEDMDHMRRVVSYVHRRQAQKPSGTIEDSTWRYSPIKHQGQTTSEYTSLSIV